MDCQRVECWSGLAVGDWATWATAAITFLALVAAAIAVKKSSDMLKVEQARDRKRDEAEEEQRRAAEQAQQADYVAVWHVEREHEVRGGVFVGADWQRFAARVQNNSPLPVWDVKVDFYGPGGEIRTSVTTAVVPPGHTDISWPVDMREVHGRDEQGHVTHSESPWAFSVGVTFRDAASRQWARDRYGRIHKVRDVRLGSASGAVEWKGTAAGKGGDDRDDIAGGPSR